MCEQFTLFEMQLLWHLRKCQIFVIIGENFSLICVVLCRVANFANFRCFLQLLCFKPNFSPIIVNFPSFRKNLIEYPEFSVYSACKNAPLYVLDRKSRIFGVFVGTFSKISILYSEYPDFSDFSPPIIDYNPKIIRFYQFFGVIDY